MKISNLCLFIVCVSLLLSCQTKEEPVTRESLLSRGFALMDRGEYDQAIAYFADMAKADPHHHVRLAWASAYAAKAGVKIEQIYSFVVVEEVQKKEVSVAGFSADANAQTAELMKSLETFARHWQQIPVLEGLTGPGPSLYRATLRVMILKSQVSQGIKNWKVLAENQSNKVCTQSLRPYLDWGVRVLNVLVGVSEDLQHAFPKTKDDYAKVEKHLKEIKEQTANAVWPKENLCL